MKMGMQQMIERLLAGQEEMKTKIKADVKAWYEMRDRGEAEGNAYMKKLFPKWKDYLEGIAIGLRHS
jgi:predicted metalloendopeptidase